MVNARLVSKSDFPTEWYSGPRLTDEDNELILFRSSVDRSDAYGMDKVEADRFYQLWCWVNNTYWVLEFVPIKG